MIFKRHKNDQGWVFYFCLICFNLIQVTMQLIQSFTGREWGWCMWEGVKV